MEAHEQGSVVLQLQNRGYIPIHISDSDDRTGGSPRSRTRLSLSSLRGHRIKSTDVLSFTHEMSTLLHAGLPLDRSLRIAGELTSNPNFTEVVEKVLSEVKGGKSFADALNSHPQTFSKLYVNMIRVGEAGGVLEQVMLRLAQYLEELRELKEYIVSALAYPILLGSVGTASVVILLTFVVPRFSVLFESTKATLPLPTRLLLGLSQGIKEYWWVALAIGILSLIAWRQYIGTPEGRLNWDRWKIRVPLLGPVFQKVEVARFSKTLGTLLMNGVPIIRSLEIVQEVIGNQAINRSLSEVLKGVKGGEGIAAPLRLTGNFPPLALHMISVGEESGRLDQMLIRVADTYDREVRTFVKRFVSLFEPILILVMGVIIGFMVIAMLLGVFSINDLPL